MHLSPRWSALRHSPVSRRHEPPSACHHARHDPVVLLANAIIKAWPAGRPPRIRPCSRSRPPRSSHGPTRSGTRRCSSSSSRRPRDSRPDSSTRTRISRSSDDLRGLIERNVGREVASRRRAGSAAGRARPRWPRSSARRPSPPTDPARCHGDCKPSQPQPHSAASNVASMNCTACGAANRVGRRFCGQCGASLDRAVPSCGAANDEGERFCGACGSPARGSANDRCATGFGTEPDAMPAAPAGVSRSRNGAMSASCSRIWSGSRPLGPARCRGCARAPERVLHDRSNHHRSIRRHRGEVHRRRRDGRLGASSIQENDAERAVRAALDLVDAVAVFGDQVGAPGLRARAGVLTGEAAVTLGVSGEGSVAGDLVNTASRIQSAAAPGAVLRRRRDPCRPARRRSSMRMRARTAQGQARATASLARRAGCGGNRRSAAADGPRAAVRRA